MESRVFIKAADQMIERIADFQGNFGTSDELRAKREVIQRDLTALFAGLYNPTLPTAFRLRDVAQRAGFSIDTRVLNNLSRFDYPVY
jgi:hypothetical protein